MVPWKGLDPSAVANSNSSVLELAESMLVSKMHFFPMPTKPQHVYECELNNSMFAVF